MGSAAAIVRTVGIDPSFVQKWNERDSDRGPFGIHWDGSQVFVVTYIRPGEKDFELLGR